MERICSNCIHFDLCESEFSFSNAKPDDDACDDFVEDEGYSDEIHWKPSDEQMDALLVKIPIENSCNKVDNILKSLYSDLKKLK